MNRRDFLHLRSLARTAGSFANPLSTLAVEPVQSGEVTLLRFTRRAMATRFEVLLPYGTAAARSIAETAFDEIDRIEKQLTVYQNDSEVGRLNQLAHFADVPTEENLFELLTLAADLNESTEGAFDITAGALIKAWGFYRGPRRVPSETELKQALDLVGMKHVRLDAAGRTVRYARRGLEINLGSIGKGYALDRVGQLLQSQWHLTSALLHGGHSSVYAMGGDPGKRHGWTVGIQHPWEPGRRLALVQLRDRALATSAATFQHLEYNGRKLGHILDPRTGWPAEGMASASVIASTAAAADALATAFFILGMDKARSYCENHPGIGAVLLPAVDGAAPELIGLTPDEVTLFG
jgi:thiamine biosynthesis lipoprotein